MRLTFIASVSATIALIAHPAIAQVSPETQPSLLETAAPVNTNISTQGTTTFDQTGVVQQFNNGVNSLTQPNCNSQICLFTLMRNSSQGTELLGGAVWQLGGSPNHTQAEAQKLLAIAQKEKLDQESTLILSEKLADAIENNKIERAKLYAISLAKRLGYADYRQLLKDIITPTGAFKY
jgi:hypothetical protein